MVEEGLAAVASPSELFLSARNQDCTNAASAAVAVTMEGSRPILLEVQVLSLCANYFNFSSSRGYLMRLFCYMYIFPYRIL